MPIGKKGLCSSCEKEGWISKPSLMLCVLCNKKRLDKNKERRKPTGEKIVFEQIWEERVCESFLTGVSLKQYEGTDRWYNLFAHVLAKGKYPKFRLLKKNILLLTPEEHRMLDQGTIDERNKYADKTGCDWDRIFKIKEELINEYRTING